MSPVNHETSARHAHFQGAGELTPTETDMDLRSRVVSLEHQHTTILQRVGDLERGQRMSDIEDAKRGEQFNNMNARFTSLDKKIDDIGGTLKWVNRAITTGIIMGVVAFMLRGGFNLP
jgi:hypothetical protein